MTGRAKEVFGEINITPLTDIFLVLLIIMMVVAPLLDYRGLNIVMAPQGGETVPQEESDVLRVVIDAGGVVSVAGLTVESNDLAAAISRESAQNPGGILIEVHPDAQLESMTQALDAARNAGVQKVRIAEMEVAAPASDNAYSAPEKKK